MGFGVMRTVAASVVTAGAAIAIAAVMMDRPAQAQLFGGPEREVPQDRTQVQMSFAPVVSEAAPAVVNVYAERLVRQRTSPFANDPFFREFFGDRFGGMPRERVSRSLGSGVIVRGDGIVVTNNHVVENAQELRVVLNDRREFEAELLLADPGTDLAVLRVDTGGDRLPTLPYDTSNDLLVGDLVLAIGNPFGVGQTVTSGIVSALGRSDVGVTDYSFFVQTDAAINPGNSGGALVDVDGELIGINTAIFSRSGGSNGIGFAIPVELVKRVVDGAVTEGRVVRPWFGAKGQAVTQDLVSSLGLERPTGLIVNELYPGSPAERAGVRVGDVVTAIDGAEVNDEQAVRFRLATLGVGERGEVSVVRGGRERTLRFTAEAPPADPPRDERLLDGTHPFAGATVANLSPAFNEELGQDLFKTGVAVVSIQSRSPASYYRVRTGDIILGINGEGVETTADLERALRARDGERFWRILYERNGRRVEQTVRF